MKRAAIPIAIVIAFLGALGIRVVIEGHRALAEGDHAAADGRLDDAVAAWESAARWYLPVGSHVDDAYARLIELASKDHRHALAAWRAVRSASLATRWLFTPHADDLLAANAAIAELASRDPEGALSAGADAAARKTWHAERLARDPGPARGGLALATLGIALWLAGVALLVRPRGPDVVGAAIALTGLVGWMIGLGVA